ncbi:MAG: AMP-binding protein [Bacilli bacterium]
MLERIINQKESNRFAYKIEKKTLTYKDLKIKAKYYSMLLKYQGNTPIIIYGHKSINTFLSIFACIEAKRAYVPIDLCTPKERIEKIIKLTKSSLILSDEKIIFKNIECLKLNELEKYKNNSLIFEIKNEIAYYIFTSGSTGNPKGVPISYDNLFNFVSWIKDIEPLNSYDNINVLNQASFSFDLSVADIFYSMYSGHTLIALDKDIKESYTGIFETIHDEKINLMVITPTFIKLCLVNKEFNEKNFSFLKCLYFCGEQLEPITVKKIFNQFPNIRVINAYGPTEATSAVSSIEIKNNMLNNDLLPVGKVGKFATNIFIHDGHIVLSGKSVFSGYVGDLVGGYYNLNNEDYFDTGDIGFIENNKLYCKGRSDSQIKYKGYRIELNDIERNIYNIKGVKECVVIAKYKDDFNVKIIKAYITIENKLDSGYIKNELKKKIPSYMIPNRIIVIEKMPINYNGKIDRKKLIEL